MHDYLFRTSFFLIKKNDMMQYVDVSESDKVLVYQLPKDTCMPT